MFRKLWLSIVAATVGAALLVGASFAAGSSAASPTGVGSDVAKRGGTLRVNVSNTDFAFVDPALQKRLFPDTDGLPLANPIASDLSVMRVSLWPALLRAALENQRRQQDRVTA